MSERHWIIVLSALLVVCAGSFFWYAQMERKNDRVATPTQTLPLGPNGIPFGFPPPPPPPTPPPSPAPPLDPEVHGPYGKNGIFEIDARNLKITIAKRTSKGILIRDSQVPDEKGIFTAIPNADDFHRLDAADSSRSGYYRAGNSVYIFSKEDIVSGKSSLPLLKHIANAEHFTLIPGLNTSIAKDDSHVYINGILDTTIDPKTIAGVPKHPSFFQDAFHVYRINDVAGPFYTITSFEPPLDFLSQPTQESWAELRGYVADAHAVYFKERKVYGADRATFSVFMNPTLHELKESAVIYPYAKDKTNVYYEGIIVPDADPVTFTPLTNGGAFTHYYGKDAYTVYEGALPIPGLDPNTVQILWKPIYEGCDNTHFVKDANNVFYERQVLIGADATTFESLILDFGRDKNGIWRGTTFRADLPKDFKPVCNYG